MLLSDTLDIYIVYLCIRLFHVQIFIIISQSKAITSVSKIINDRKPTVCWKFELLGSQEMIADVEVMFVACKQTNVIFFNLCFPMFDHCF